MKTKTQFLTMAVMIAGIGLMTPAGASAEGEGRDRGGSKKERPDRPKPDRPDRPDRPKGQGRPERKGGAGDFFKKLDADGDGEISKAEAGERWERLSRLDKNDDGVISKEEVAAGGRSGGGRPDGKRFENADKNGDGKLTEDEVPAEAWARISKADKDGDKAVSKEEMMAIARGGGGRAGGGGGGGGGGGAGHFFEMADKNKDGKITEDEAGERWERLSKLDKDGDGAVSKDELPQRGAGRGGSGGVGGGGAAALFGRYDKDGDGKISQDDVPAELWARLSKADENADGLVSKKELEAAHAGARGGAGRPDGKKKKKDRPERD